MHQSLHHLVADATMRRCWRKCAARRRLCRSTVQWWRVLVDRSGFQARAFHAAGFLGTDVVECLVHIGDDVEAVEDMQRLGAVFADELQMVSSPFEVNGEEPIMRRKTPLRQQ